VEVKTFHRVEKVKVSQNPQWQPATGLPSGAGGVGMGYGEDLGGGPSTKPDKGTGGGTILCIWCWEVPVSRAPTCLSVGGEKEPYPKSRTVENIRGWASKGGPYPISQVRESPGGTRKEEQKKRKPNTPTSDDCGRGKS